ncbi:hypothetical protein KL86SPO_50186 [uncultured Sporomusa sp.]|uniref:Uncharacterized protein n=1 Tax=uncultured Sporomusa sp. TaxID=307249 RepID=A0A212LXX3_9FIRM|nr:hypothetical protein [uncultured Sporomusa sp.]SCM82415.1 hypothetical protein KL86SPO_50186 [uncultured Sporomusa sp.]
MGQDSRCILANEEQIRQFIKCRDLDEPSQSHGKTVWEDNFSHWKYKLRLGDQAYLSTEDTPKKLKKGEYITIKPGDFALLITKEKVILDKETMAFISMRFDYKQKGLINVSGFHVDPYYEGKLIFSVFNAGARDIVLRQGDPVFMIFFQKISEAIDKDKPTTGYDFIPADMVEQIRGKSATLASNASRLDKVEFHLKVVGGLCLAAVVLLLGIVIRKYFGD